MTSSVLSDPITSWSASPSVPCGDPLHSKDTRCSKQGQRILPQGLSDKEFPLASDELRDTGHVTWLLWASVFQFSGQDTGLDYL